MISNHKSKLNNNNTIPRVYHANLLYRSSVITIINCNKSYNPQERVSGYTLISTLWNLHYNNFYQQLLKYFPFLSKSPANRPCFPFGIIFKRCCTQTITHYSQHRSCSGIKMASSNIFTTYKLFMHQMASSNIELHQWSSSNIPTLNYINGHYHPINCLPLSSFSLSLL